MEGLMFNDGWKRTNDKVGHAPRFVITCKICRPWWRRKVKMVLRNSKLMISTWTEKGEKRSCYVNRMNYKCPECEWVTGFIIPDSQKYLEMVMEWRGSTLYYPTMAEWGENEQVRKKLESLGYF